MEFNHLLIFTFTNSSSQDSWLINYRTILSFEQWKTFTRIAISLYLLIFLPVLIVEYFPFLRINITRFRLSTITVIMLLFTAKVLTWNMAANQQPSKNEAGLFKNLCFHIEFCTMVNSTSLGGVSNSTLESVGILIVVLSFQTVSFTLGKLFSQNKSHVPKSRELSRLGEQDSLLLYA